MYQKSIRNILNFLVFALQIRIVFFSINVNGEKHFNDLSYAENHLRTETSNKDQPESHEEEILIRVPEDNPPQETMNSVQINLPYSKKFKDYSRTRPRAGPQVEDDMYPDANPDAPSYRSQDIPMPDTPKSVILSDPYRAFLEDGKVMPHDPVAQESVSPRQRMHTYPYYPSQRRYPFGSPYNIPGPIRTTKPPRDDDIPSQSLSDNYFLASNSENVPNVQEPLSKKADEEFNAKKSDPSYDYIPSYVDENKEKLSKSKKKEEPKEYSLDFEDTEVDSTTPSAKTVKPQERSETPLFRDNQIKKNPFNYDSNVKKKMKPKTYLFTKPEITTEKNYSDWRQVLGLNLKDPFEAKKVTKCNFQHRAENLRHRYPMGLSNIFKQFRKWRDSSMNYNQATDIIELTKGNLTMMLNPLYMIQLDEKFLTGMCGKRAPDKVTIVIISGLEGRDHMAVEAARSFVEELVNNRNEHLDILKKYRFWVVPVLNPDGYEYSLNFDRKENWQKNLHQRWNVSIGFMDEDCYNLGIDCLENRCNGVNIDRNFENQWIPSSNPELDKPCGPLYGGSEPLSEVETKSLANFLGKQKNLQNVHFFVIKEGSRLGITYPYAHTKHKRRFDNIYRTKAMGAARAASNVAGRAYVAGQTSEFQPLYAGGAEDWAEGHLGMDHAYALTVATRNDYYNAEFNAKIVSQEAFAAITAMLPLTDNIKPKPHNAASSLKSRYRWFLLAIIHYFVYRIYL